MTTNQLTAVSLFAGVGGFDIALERCGAKVTAAVEIDDSARGVLAHHFPSTQLFTDVCEVTGDQLKSTGFIPERGIIVGGFPCQDLSVAGRRAGLAGARSGLFWEICRLLDETKTKWIILENVPGLLSSNGGRDMGTVIGALAELGYGVAYRILDAQFFGVPQRRRRVFIVGCLGDDGRASAEILALLEGGHWNSEASEQTRKDPASKTSKGSRASSLIGSDIVGALCASDNKFPQQQQVHENKIVIQDSVSTYVKVVRSGARDENGELPPDVWAEREVAPTLNVFDNGGEARATVVVTIPIQSTVIGRSETSGPQGRGHGDENDPMFTLDTVGSHGVAVIPIHDTATRYAGKRKLADGTYVEDGKGNGLGIGEEGDPMNTLTSGDRHAVVQLFEADRRDGIRLHGDITPTLQSFMGTGGNNVPMVSTSIVRRLTPVECERLQGFPDGWTAQRYDYKKQTVVAQADSSRYKQMGNAVAVPVVQWIVSRLVAFEAGEL